MHLESAQRWFVHRASMFRERGVEMMRTQLVLVWSVTAVLLVACKNEPSQTASPPPSPAPTAVPAPAAEQPSTTASPPVVPGQPAGVAVAGKPPTKLELMAAEGPFTSLNAFC